MYGKGIIIPGILLGTLYTVFGLLCFALSREYIHNTCGFESFSLQQWMLISGIVYYLSGLMFLSLSIFIDYEKRLKNVGCVWIITVLAEGLFTIIWSLTGAADLLIDDNCRIATHGFWTVAVVTVSVVPSAGTILSCIILLNAAKYRDDEFADTSC